MSDFTVNKLIHARLILCSEIHTAIRPIQCIVSGEENSKIGHSPWDFVTPAKGGLSHGHRQHAQKIGKDRMFVFLEIRSRTDRQTDTQTCSL